MMSGGMSQYDQVVLYRFKVRTADGREALSRIAVVPVRDGQEQKSEATMLAEASPSASPSAAPSKEELEAKLSNPRWSGDSFKHGEQATVEVDAPGLDGQVVRFNFEHQLSGEWTAYATTTAVVANGVASGALELQHPGQGEQADSPADLRFTCELV
jgi:hypothetical protein